MLKRLGLLALAAAFVLAIPVTASATDDGEAPSQPPPIDLEERFDTFDEAVAAVTERLMNALERMSDRYDRAAARDSAPEELLERLSTAIDQIDASLAAVEDAEGFDELDSILEEAREQRRELRADRPHRLHRCRPPLGHGAGAD
jgi:hypothetical protein